MINIRLLLTVMLVAMSLVSCRAVDSAAVVRDGRIMVVSGVKNSEEGACFIGVSDPFIDETGTWALAADRARARLFSYYCPSSQKTGTMTVDSTVSAGGTRRVLIRELDATLRGVKVVGWWFDTAGKGPRGSCDGRCHRASVWSVACVEGFEGHARKVLPEAFRGNIPSWMKNPSALSGMRCAFGISGPTLNADDAGANAEKDARERLATMICGRERDIFVLRDTGDDWFGYSLKSVVAGEAKSWVDGFKGGDGCHVDVWVDADGVGPLGVKGGGYARVCVPDGPVACPVTRECRVAM